MATGKAIGIDIGRSQIKAQGSIAKVAMLRFSRLEDILLTQPFYLTLRCFLQKNTWINVLVSSNTSALRATLYDRSRTASRRLSWPAEWCTSSAAGTAESWLRKCGRAMAVSQGSIPW